MATSAPPAAPITKPYRRLLTSALHTRFVHAAAIALILDWDNAFWIGNKRSLVWSWFPLGPAGLKTLLLFVSTLTIFILYVATLNIGKRTTTSPFATIRRSLFSSSSFKILFAYVFSAFWFGEVYIWSASEFARLGWLVPGDMSTPDKLNERPIYLRAVFFLLGVAQSIRHLYKDSSSLSIPLPSPAIQPKEGRQTQRFGQMQVDWQKLVISTLISNLWLVVPTTMIGPFVYSLLLRKPLWYIHLQLAKPFSNLSRANAKPTGYPPCNPILMGRSAIIGFLMALEWELVRFLFLNFLGQEPTKKDLPLSAGSRDPNGTLLNGLKAKRDVVKTFAFWELAIITEKQPERRKAIFADIERPGGPCWTSMQEVALAVVRSIDDRIKNSSSKKAVPVNPNSANQVKTMALPKIAPNVSDKRIVTNPPKPKSRIEMAEQIAGQGMKSIGQSSNPWNPPSPNIDRLLSQVKQFGSSAEDNSSLLERLGQQMMHSPIGWFLRRTNERRINAVVLGHPHSQVATIVHAIDSVTKMLVASLSEDVYGKAVADVPTAVKTFSTTILAITNFVHENGEGVGGGIEDVEIVVEKLKNGLKELLSAFQLYLSDVGLSITELNTARRASEKRALLPTRAQSDEEHSEMPKMIEQDHLEGNIQRQERITRQNGEKTLTQGREMEMTGQPRRLFPSASKRSSEFRDVVRQPSGKVQAGRVDR